MGRWGWRRIAALCVSVWVMSACGPFLPAPSVEPTLSPQGTLALRTASPQPSASATASARETAASPAAQPAASQTPGSSPTPHYYTVADGDTLAAIAARFGVSVEALQAANGGLPPDMIRPGQVLLIPSAMSASASETFVRFIPTDTPLPLPLSPPVCYRTPADEAICLGWVANTQSVPLEGIIVQVTLRDGSGAVQEQQAVAVTQGMVPPDGGAPYAAYFQSPPTSDHAAATVLSAAAADPEQEDIVPLQVRDEERGIENGVVRVRGRLFHEGSAPLRDLLVVITLFDADDRVTGFRILRPEGVLAPGESLAVDALVTPLGAGTARHALYGEGHTASAGP